MKSRAFLLALCFLSPLTLCQAQTNNNPCPTIRVTSPDFVPEGHALTFIANVTSPDNNSEETFNWIVSAGKIQSGQGTTKIKVDTNGLAGQFITATVAVGGYDQACQTSASSTSGVNKKIDSTKSDEYNSTTVKLETHRLDRFALALQQQPTTMGYIMAYGGRVGKAGEAQAIADRTRDYLVSRGINSSNLVTVDAGFREQLTTELWLVPTGAKPPLAEPTVDPNEIKPLSEGPVKPAKPTKSSKPAKKATP